MSLELSGTIIENNFDRYKKSLQNSELKIIIAKVFFILHNRDEIIELIFGNRNLEKIDFMSQSLNNYASNISNALLHNTNLKVLDIGINKFDPDNFCKIMNTLKTNNTLEELYMNNCRFGYSGAKEIANMLLTNTTLRKLHIWINYIGDNGFTEIINALEFNITLMELDVTHYNGITENIIPQLMKMLEINNVITIHGIDHLVPEDFFLSRNNCKKIKSARNKN